MIPKPPRLEDLTAGIKLNTGLHVSTVLPDMDFETYSEAGYIWNNNKNQWVGHTNAKDKGLSVVGVVAYSEHSSTEVLCLAYDLKDGLGKRQWIPGQPLSFPHDLIAYIKPGGIIEAWNCAFEYYIWNNICVRRYNFPPLHYTQMRDAMAKSRAFSLPGKLEEAGNILDLKNKKDKEGKRLLAKYSVPRNPTKKDLNRRNVFDTQDIDAKLLLKYNLQDIAAEAEASSLIPDLLPDELQFWLCDQAINRRGVQVDMASVKNCITIIEQAQIKYNKELPQLTNNAVSNATEIQKIREWLQLSQGIYTENLNAETVDKLLSDNLPPKARRVLEIRKLINSASVKKLYAIQNQVSSAGRLHELFIYHSARTGRAAGAGPQPQNLPNSGPAVTYCYECNKYNLADKKYCAYCNSVFNINANPLEEWNYKAVEDVLEVVKTQSLEAVEYYYNNATEIVSGCLRGLFIAADNHFLICSDYSAIEAVVLAALAGEEWRLEVFRTHGMIYEMSAAKITGISFDEFINHKKQTGHHHPLRKKVGKVAELAGGYQGGVKAWKAFGADEFFNNDEEIKNAVIAWRKASPNIVEMWGGQSRKFNTEYFGLEGAAILAILNPGNEFNYREITYQVYQDILYCKLLSGRYIVYHKPKLIKNDFGNFDISYEGWNSNQNYGKSGWMRIYTFGGRLTENVVQATARDILAHAIINLEKAGYKIVLHIHDEIVAEVHQDDSRSLEEFERIMSTMPPWAKGWPIIAKDGWIGKRYRK